jgi:hypothetical protein
MRDLLEEIDADYYRAARLLIVRAELEQLRRRSSTAAGATGRRKVASTLTTDGGGRQPVPAANSRSVCPEVETGR